MGIKGFSKIFIPKTIKQKDLKNLTGAFDASVILFQCCLGMSSVNGLTDASGNPTLHINVIISRVINFIKNSTGQVWVFDFHDHSYSSPDKELELVKRRNRRADAKKKLEALHNTKNNLFTDSDNDDNDDAATADDVTAAEDAASIRKKINQQEKIIFSINEQIINDCKFILNCFDITWCVAPKGIEAEAVCAALTTTDELNFECDFVYSTDVDSLLYGAKQLVRSVKADNKKVLQLYNIDTLLTTNNIDIDDLIKIGIILGSDHAPKTQSIGPKTVLRKFKTINLSEVQEKAVKIFKPSQLLLNMSSIKFHNEFDAVEPASNIKKLNQLLDWLELKNFNRERIRQQIIKVNPDI